VSFLALLVGAYFLGGVPVGVLVARAYGVNIFEVGSGNIGATNVSRILGWKAWAFVFVPDVLKGVIPALIAKLMLTQPVGPLDIQAAAFVAGLVAVAGHCWSPFLGFRGGKGVATALGAGLGAAPLVALSSFALFGVVLLVTRYMAIASVLGVSATMMFGLIFRNQSIQMEPFYALLSTSVALRHLKNFRRLLKGTEPKFGRKKEQGTATPANPPGSDERLQVIADEGPGEDGWADGFPAELSSASAESPGFDERA
jgi:glycerol-3-phosphate acyltransferase PlsY